MYWRDWRSLERAAKRFRESKAQARLAERAEHISLLSLDEVEFEDIMQELCQVNFLKSGSKDQNICAVCANVDIIYLEIMSTSVLEVVQN